MTKYRDDLDVPVRSASRTSRRRSPRCSPSTTFASCTSAETEKYAHVTYFFNGGREAEWSGETRVLVPSPRDVPSYDHKPEMSAAEVADRFVEELRREPYAFAVVNFATRTWSATQDRSPQR
jgi:2,3-bisphosphoglycerate-independent phosphoglycerate mutase